MSPRTAPDRNRFFARLHEAGLPPVPGDFSVVPAHQIIAPRVIAAIDRFIAVFDAVTMRREWQRGVTADAPPIARGEHSERCFFSAWDLHLPPEAPEQFKLIEFNDNGSGFLFAALINRLYFEWAGLANDSEIEQPPTAADFQQHLVDCIAAEAQAFFGEIPRGGYLILDDAASLARGRFRREHALLCSALRARNLCCATAAPAQLSAHGERLACAGTDVRFVIDRSTDFFWETDAFAPLRTAWLAGGIYAAPSPFTYATRSDKRLLAVLSDASRDAELGIEPAERALLDAHVPETRLLSEASLDALAERKRELVFKPAHGFAGRGVLPGEQVGKARLRRLLRKGALYVAQARVPKRSFSPEEAGGAQLWTDLRVWAYRGRRLAVSGRASTAPERLALGPPGGWLPTYCRH